MIAQFLFKNPRILLLVICVIVVAGLSAFTLLPRLEDPVLRKRVAVISTVYPGADSKRVESLVTMAVEQRLRGIADINQVRSTSRTGISNIIIELHDNVYDVDSVWTLVRNRLTDVQAELPDGCLRPEFEVFPLKAYAAIIAIKSQKTEYGPSIVRRLARELATRIGNLRGTESVGLFGDAGEEFVAEIDATDLASLRLSTAAIANQVASANETHPAGFLRGEDSDLLLDLDADTRSTQDLEESRIRFPADGYSVKLSEIADVEKRLVVPASQLALIDGRPAIVLGAFVEDQLRVDQWASAFHATIADFQSEFVGDVAVEVIFSQNQYVTARLDLLLKNLLFGGVAVVAVVLLLMGWRSMIIVGSALPLSALMVLSGMRAMQIPMHQMSITGLIVALGLLIDNAIVIVEDVRSRILGGATANQAIARGIRHLKMPLFGSTLTTTLAFMPIATLPGPPGEFVGTIAMSVILAIGSSFLLAMTVVPAMLALMRVDRTTQNVFSYGIANRSVTRLYRWSLATVFRFPLLGVLIGIALPVCGFWVAQELPEQFFPPSDRNQLHIEVELPAREPIGKTLATVNVMQQFVTDHEAVVRAHWFVGGSAPTFYYNVVPRRRGTPFYAQAIVELREGFDNTSVIRSLQGELNQKHAECRVLVRQLEQGPPFDAPIEIRVSGPNGQIRRQLGNQLRLILSQTSHVVHTRSDSAETIPKLMVHVAPHAAAQAGLNETEIAQSLYTTLEGAPAGNVLDGEEELPVRIKMASAGDVRMDRLAALQLLSPMRRAPTGPPGQPPTPVIPTPLGAISEFKLESDWASITRIDGVRTNEVQAYIEAGVLPSTVLSEFKRRLAAARFTAPDGYSIEYGGERAQRSHAVQNLIANAVVLFALIVLSLVASFRSFRRAFIIMLVGGLAMGLGPLALWLFDFPFGFMAIVGTMGLVGVAINDSIVVLAAIGDHDRARGGDVSQLTDVVMGCTRHILTTTLTTIVGFLPLILAGGGFWPPLAICIAAGVAGATFLALYFVPSMNLLLHSNPHPK